MAAKKSIVGIADFDVARSHELIVGREKNATCATTLTGQLQLPKVDANAPMHGGLGEANHSRSRSNGRRFQAIGQAFRADHSLSLACTTALKCHLT